MPQPCIPAPSRKVILERAAAIEQTWDDETKFQRLVSKHKTLNRTRWKEFVQARYYRENRQQILRTREAGKDPVTSIWSGLYDPPEEDQAIIQAIEDSKKKKWNDDI